MPPSADPASTPHLRVHGTPPWRAAVIHGGPGGAGELAPVARELSRDFGVLEPLQTARSVTGQVAELAAVLKLKTHAGAPIPLIGHSWGAWLSLIVAAEHPALVQKLILVSSGVFDASYVPAMHATRLSRLDEGERAEFTATIAALEGDGTVDDARLARLAELSDRTDSYAPIEPEPVPEAGSTFTEGQAAIYAAVWPEAAAMRASGELLARAGRVACPIVTIHGDTDPSPAAGVAEPLRTVVPDLRLRVLDRCGHTPWRERYAREPFYTMLREELATP